MIARPPEILLPVLVQDFFCKYLIVSFRQASADDCRTNRHPRKI